MQFEFFADQRLAQVHFQFAPRFHSHVHVRLEKPKSSASVGLGAVERHVGVAQQRIGLLRVERRDRDADADIGDNLVPFDLVRLDDRLADALGKRSRVGRFLHLGHDDGEFVAAQTGNRIGLSGAAAQTVGDQFQQFVPDRMAERIVDALELIEIEAQDRQTLTAFDAFEFMFQPFAQQDAVGQIGQRVMARHVGNSPFRALPLGDVLVGCQPSAARDRLAHDRKCPAIG